MWLYGAVSYTHLDVYKRQVIWSMRKIIQIQILKQGIKNYKKENV